jgi:hypothetical protein
MNKTLSVLLREANTYCMKKFNDSMQGGVTDPWDINNGLCEVWAEYVVDRLPGAELVWLDEIAQEPEMWDTSDPDENYFLGPSHCVVRYKNKLYDAECHTGVTNWRKLPVEVNKNKTREQVIAARKVWS